MESLYSEVQDETGLNMSGEGGGLYSEVPCPKEARAGRGVLYGEVQCIMGDGHMGPPPPTDRHD